MLAAPPPVVFAAAASDGLLRLDSGHILPALALALVGLFVERAPLHLRGGSWTATFAVLAASAAFSVIVAATAAAGLFIIEVIRRPRRPALAAGYAIAVGVAATLVGVITVWTPTDTDAQTLIVVFGATVVAGLVVTAPAAGWLTTAASGLRLTPRRLIATARQPAGLATLAMSPLIAATSFSLANIHPAFGLVIAALVFSWSQHSHRPPPPPGSVRQVRDSLGYPLLVVEIQQLSTIALVHGTSTAEALMESVQTTLTQRFGEQVHQVAFNRIAVQLTPGSPVTPDRQARNLLTAIAGVRTIGKAEVPVSGRAGVAAEGSGRAIDEAEFALTHADGEVVEFTADMVLADGVTAAAALIGAVQPDSVELGATYTPTMTRALTFADQLYAEPYWDSLPGHELTSAQLMGVADRMGLQTRLTARLIDAVCADLASFDDVTTVDVAVPPSVLTDPALADMMMRTARRFSLSPDRLNVAISDVASLPTEHARRGCEALAAAGIGITADLVGGAGWSFHALTSFPITKIRLDPHLGASLDVSRTHQAAVQAIVKIAESLSVATTLPGVTTRRSVDAAAALGIDMVSGPLSGVGLDADELLDRLSADR